MPEFTWKWWWQKVFQEFEARDLLVLIITAGTFYLILADKIPAEHIGKVLIGLAMYALGRPNSIYRDGEQ